MENKYKRLAKNSFWTMIGNTGSKILSFLLLPLYTRWLGTAGFGESDLVTTYSSFLVCVMTLCISDAIFVFTKNKEESIKKAFFSASLNLTILLLGIWALLWAALDTVLGIFEVKNSFVDNLWLIYGIVVTTFIQNYFQQFILSLEKIKIYSLTGIIHTILTFVASFLLIPTMGVRGYILSMIISNLLTGLYSFIFSKSYLYFAFKQLEWQKVKEVLKFSIPLIPNGIMWWLVGALNRPLMEYHLSYSDIGIFAVANRFPAVINMVFAVFMTAWNISVFEEYGKEGYEIFYKRTFRMIFTAITFFAGLVIVSSQLIIEIFAAPDFFEAWKYMIPLIIGAVFSCMSGFFATNFSVVRKSKYHLYSSIWGAGTAIIMNFILIPQFGLWGTSLSVVISFIVMMMSRYVYCMKFVKISLVKEIVRYSIVMVLLAIVNLMPGGVVLKVLLSATVLLLLMLFEGSIIKNLLEAVVGHLRGNNEK